ncbi:helix-turn-helix domain-containing protein [Bradyrhizobium sp. CCGUVB14]|uniref:helix-turn-helix domain-containing protein n=1 Tax=Bradyrhizobium sp. CCGUVB14 TaxID=2949628 RepID=UPI002115788A|nr:helix-turn-helix transcriptional regulator [Bradyrhizobium sp. CCGUVB14]
MDIRRLIGENIRVRRLAAKLSQEAFAAKIGVEQSYLSGLEAGRRNPTAVTLWHVAIALRIKPGALFETPPADLVDKKKGRGRPRND